MADPISPSDIPAMPWKALRVDAPAAGDTERIMREAWRHYYVAQLAEAQFGPQSLEASIARSRALTSYRELHGSLRELEPKYASARHWVESSPPATRHLKLVRDEPSPAADASGEL